MASFRKRGAKWRAEVYVLGKRESKTFHTKAEAVGWANAREAELEGRALPRMTFRQALVRYREQVSDRRAGGRWEALRLLKMERDIACVDKPLASVTTADLAEWRDVRSAQVGPASVRREMGLLGGVLELARKEWQWIRVNPLRDVSKPKRPAPRRRRISQDEIDRIAMALNFMGDAPESKTQEVALAYVLAIETGMRSSEILRLRQRDLQLADRYLHINKSKNGDARDVPLSTRAWELLALMGDRDPLFTVSAGSRDKLFRDARDRAQIEGLTFHDSRHEACTRLAAKVHVLELARIMGQRDVRSLMIYFESSASEIAQKLD